MKRRFFVGERLCITFSIRSHRSGLPSYSSRRHRRHQKRSRSRRAVAEPSKVTDVARPRHTSRPDANWDVHRCKPDGESLFSRLRPYSFAPRSGQRFIRIATPSSSSASAQGILRADHWIVRRNGGQRLDSRTIAMHRTTGIASAAEGDSANG